MKKIMFAVAAAAALFAMADAIESQNIVGYQGIDVPAGTSMRTATFRAMVGEYKVSDIKVDGAMGDGSEYGQMINADGTWGDTYYFLTEDMVGVDTGWYKDATGDEPVTDADVLGIGQGFVITSGADVTFTYAGQVLAGSTVVSVPAGTSMVGNPTVCAALFSTITADGATGDGSEYGQKINSDGTWGDTYYYLTEDMVGVDTGWYKDATGDEPVDQDEALEPGETMCFTSGADFELSFPTVL